MIVDLGDKSALVLGGGDFSQEDLSFCLKYTSKLISADGGINFVDSINLVPDFIIGDIDSLDTATNWKELGTTILQIDEQETTDFEKCLYSVSAFSYLCLGFIGKRVDHFLANCSSLFKYRHKKIVLIGTHDLVLHIPKKVTLNLEIGTRFSLFPLKTIKGVSSEGLKWSLNDVTFDPSFQVGTSNVTTLPQVHVELSNEGMLLMLPRKSLHSIINFFQCSNSTVSNINS